MDRSLAARLNEASANYDSGLYRKLAKLGSDYVTSGTSALDYFIPSLDVCNDIANCYAPTTKEDFEKDRGAPENFIHPMGATETATMTTFVSQILFGGETTRRVEPRNPDDEKKADTVNELLAWNDGQQPTYNQGYHFIWDAFTFNRGVMYDRWKEMLEVTLEPVETELPYEPQDDPERPGKKLRKPRDWTPEKTTRFRKKRTAVGGFVKIDNLSPYDFICDPTLPLSRFQEGRFAGHRVSLPWQELKRRSELPVDDYQYVLPKTVEKLKNSRGRRGTPTASKSAGTSTSRTALERGRRSSPMTTVTGNDKINKEDGGVIDCWCLQLRARPKTYDIFEDDEDELIEILIAGDTDLLAVNVMTNKHDQYPYAVGEARPGAHQQFAPSWTMIIKGCQDFVDYMKNRRKESLSRTSGNIFVFDPTCVNIEDFLNPKKDGLCIPLTPEAAGRPIDTFFKQVPVTDTTARFHEEMMAWVKTAEDASGAHAATQGQLGEGGDVTATEYVGTQQMSAGRISTLSRLLSASSLVPQTQRIISNLQQFLPEEIVIRITGEHDAFDPDAQNEKFMAVRRDASAFEQGGTDEQGNVTPRDPRADLPDIQGTFDVVVHDGSLPGTDARKVAALSRGVEAFSNNPAFAMVFDNTIPGAIDPRKMFYKLLKATGFPVGDLAVTKEQALKNLQEKNLAMGNGLGMPFAAGAPTPQPPNEPVEAGITMPSASELPPTPTAAPPQPRPENSPI